MFFLKNKIYLNIFILSNHHKYKKSNLNKIVYSKTIF